jgi:hypothetical protein
MAYRFQTIVHPTDLSELSVDACAHALRIALVTKSKRYLVHIAESRDPSELGGFPLVRQALEQWHLMKASEPSAEVANKLRVAKIDLRPQNPLRGLLHFLDQHPTDLIVMRLVRCCRFRQVSNGFFQIMFPTRKMIATIVSHSLLRLVAGFVACVLGSAALDAAEIRVDPSRGEAAEAVLEGKIGVGDFDKVVSFILDGHRPVQVYLASPGGELADAMKIGLLVRTLKLSTVVPSKALTNQNRDLIAAQHDLRDPKADYMCASACFFIFVAGIHRSYDLAGPAILGIHSPSLSKNSVRTLSLEQASETADRVRTVVEKYLRDMGVPSKYGEDMYLEPAGKIQWIRNDEFEADFDGFIPQLRDWADGRCGKLTDAEKKIGEGLKYKADIEQTTAEESKSESDTMMKKYEEQLTCERKIQDELALRAYKDAPEIQNGKVPRSTNGMP